MIYLTREQVFALNEKHGWFEYGDGQSDVSKAFAQDAIEMHERVRAAAPDLLALLVEVVAMHNADKIARCSTGEGVTSQDFDELMERVDAAIARATGAPA